MSKQTTGEFLSTLRKANGYTQQDVAEKLNISNRTLSSWETDRTLPDVLMLPAIADLYEVTVDELLRGERNYGVKSVDISDSSIKNVYKNKFGAFASKCSLMLGLALTCAAIFILGCALSLWTNAPSWLDWVLLIIGIVGLCACIAVAAYQYNNVKLSVGVVLDEDLTDDKKAFIAALRHKLENLLLICALPFALFALIALIVFIIADPQNGQIMGFTFYVRYGYIFIICVNAVASMALLIYHLVLKSVSVKKYYNEKQQATAKLNRRIAGKLAAFGAIPIAVVIILNIVLTLAFPNGYKTLHEFDDFDAFKTHMQTLEVNGDYGIPIDEYYLPIPDAQPENGTEVDLGNGFYGTYYSENYTTNDFGSFVYHRSYWAVTYGKPERFNQDGYVIEFYQPTWDLRVKELSGGKYVNARYYWNDDILIDETEGRYTVFLDISNTLTDIAIYTLTIVPVCTLITCAAIYTTKRKKQKYGFGLVTNK